MGRKKNTSVATTDTLSIVDVTGETSNTPVIEPLLDAANIAVDGEEAEAKKVKSVKRDWKKLIKEAYEQPWVVGLTVFVGGFLLAFICMVLAGGLR